MPKTLKWGEKHMGMGNMQSGTHAVCSNYPSSPIANIHVNVELTLPTGSIEDQADSLLTTVENNRCRLHSH